MNTRHDPLVEATRLRGGFESIDAARRSLEAVLAVVGGALPEVHARALASHLPRSAALAVLAGIGLGDRVARELPGSLARLENVPLERAVEHLVIVGSVLAEHLDDQEHSRLRLLPEPLAAFFAWPPRSPLEHASHVLTAVAPGAGATLATGRPGSRHPLSEASPAQHGSVAREDNPRADRKLSSGYVVAPEDTLAAGRPGSRHPLSEGGGD